jgi:hypothetical protein
MPKKKTETGPAFLVPVRADALEGVLECLRCRLEDDYNVSLDRGALAGNEALLEAVRVAMGNQLESRYFVEDIACEVPFEKLFRAEIKAQRLREAAEERAAAAANRAEEERLRKDGRILAVRAEDAGMAEGILRAAGIDVKLL